MRHHHPVIAQGTLAKRAAKQTLKRLLECRGVRVSGLGSTPACLVWPDWMALGETMGADSAREVSQTEYFLMTHSTPDACQFWGTQHLKWGPGPNTWAPMGFFFHTKYIGAPG